jgi:hypothetical protein
LFDSEQINDLLGEDLLGKQVFAEKTKWPPHCEQAKWPAHGEQANDLLTALYNNMIPTWLGFLRDSR